MSTPEAPRPPLPPFTRETAVPKVRLAAVRPSAVSIGRRGGGPMTILGYPNWGRKGPSRGKLFRLGD